jgi:hypothetical protein
VSVVNSALRLIEKRIATRTVAMQTTPGGQTREWRLIARGILALIYKRANIDALTDADHALNLSSNDQLRRARPEAQERSKQETAVNVDKRLEILRRNILWSLVILGSAATASLLVSILLPDRSAQCRAWLGGSSLFIFAWATLGRLGWPGQSFGGNTVVERLDHCIFKTLYWLGTFLGILALI